MRHAHSLALLVALSLAAAPAGADHCSERPTPGPSRSLGRTSKGRLEGAARFDDSSAARILPARHRKRCLNWATARLVAALHRAGGEVRRRHPGSEPLGVGNLSRAAGGSLRPYSRSHQSGRDADLAFYLVDADGRPAPVEDLVRLDAKGRERGGARRFDAARNWTLVRSLLTDPAIEVRWLFVSRPLRALLLAEARRRGEPARLVERAGRILHRPSDAPAHDDHFHLRIACSAGERSQGCR